MFQVERAPQELSFGRQGESNILSYAFDFSEWAEDWPGGLASMTVILPNETQPQPIPDTQAVVDGNVITLHVLDNLTAKHGRGTMIIRYTVGDNKKRSRLIEFVVEKGHETQVGSGIAVVDDWVDEATKTLNDVKSLEAANAGTTANRPLNEPIGHGYYDTTLNKPVWVKTAGVRETDTLTITAGANASGDITITLNGVAVTVSVSEGDTVVQVDAKIRAVAYAGWGVSGTAGSGVVVFTRDNAGTALAPEFSAASTGVEGSISRTTNGNNAVWVDAAGATV